MNNIYVRDILRICDGSRKICGNDDLVLNNFCTDSRLIKKDDVYVALVGENFDGNDFYESAISKGCKCVIISRDVDCVLDDVTVIYVRDTLKCLQELAMYKRSLYDIPVIAVTGSVGKTSTKDIIYSVVSQKYRTLKTMGNYNNHIGVPLTVLSLDDEEALVIEMGMNHLGEISLLSKIAKPTISVITNVGTAHIGNLGSRENILKAKLEILDGMIGNDLVINIDNDMLKSCLDNVSKNYNVSTVSINEESKYKAVNIIRDSFSSKFDIDNVCSDVLVNVYGDAFIYNAMVSYAVGNILGISDELIKSGINEFKLSSHRLEKKVNDRGVTIIDDTYNANYDSMKAAILMIGSVKDKRKILILGDMLELGEYSEKLHSSLGDVVCESNIDVLIAVGDASKKISERASSLGFKGKIYNFDNESLINYEFLEKFDSNDIILLKGSHGMNLVNVVDRLCDKR